jgi:ribosomal protein S18 acetylase RimI-like enzyme
VRASNEDALAFYKKHGFATEKTVENYYKRIDPPHAHVLVRAVERAAPTSTAKPAAADGRK